MAAPRRFDHEEARRLRAEGWTYMALADRFRVSDTAVARVCDERVRARLDARTRQYLRDKRAACAGGCGRLVWIYNGIHSHSGYCRSCWGAKLRAETKVEHGTETRYVSYGCRCDACRAASAEARRRRRARSAA